MSEAEILFVDSFLAMKTCYRLIKEFEALVGTGCTRRCDDRRVEMDARHISAIVSDIRQEVKKRTHSQFIDYTLLTKMLPGDSHTLHADNATLDGEPNHTPWRTHVALIYLNTCHVDFEGGQLCLPDYDLEISPQIGGLVLFPCSSEFKHSVSEIKSGARYSLAMWFTDDPSHEEQW